MRVIGMLLGIPEEDLKAVQLEADERLRTEPGKPMEADAHNFGGMGFAEYIAWRAKHPSDDLMTELLAQEIVDEKGDTRKLTLQEIEIFCTTLPRIGVRSLRASHARLPSGERFQRRNQTTPAMPPAANTHQKVVRIDEIPISIRVGSGRVPPRSAYMPSKIGTTKSSIPETIRKIRLSTTTG